MNNCFRFKATYMVGAKEIVALRHICPHSISEIKRRASLQESLLDIPIFSGEWPASKVHVISLLHDIENGVLPLAIFLVEIGANSQESEEIITVAQARQHLQFFRDIALKQDLYMQLEQGYISSPDEYLPLPEGEA